MSVLGATAVAAGASLLGGLFSSKGQKSANKANLEQQRLANQGNIDLANLQYQNDINMWNKQNAYNTPSAQMQRYIDAGLNPNLIYGQGSSGNASSSPQFHAPTLGAYTGQRDALTGGISTAMQSFMNLAQRENLLAQNDNLLAQNDAIRQNTLNATIEATGLAMRNARSELEYKMAQDTYSYSVEAAKLGVRNLEASINNTYADTENKLLGAEQKRLDIKFDDLRRDLTAAQIDNLRESTAKLMQDRDFASFEQDLKRIGIYPNDALFNRILGRVLGGFEELYDRNPPTNKFQSGLLRFSRFLKQR